MGVTWGWGGPADPTDLTAHVVPVRKQGKHLLASHVLRTNEWYHIAFSSGAEGMQLYLDGVLVGTNSALIELPPPYRTRTPTGSAGIWLSSGPMGQG